MTKEQLEVCEKLGQHHLGSWEKDNDYPVFKEGFQAAQTPEMLMLNPLVKGLVEALHKSECESHYHHEGFSCSNYPCFIYEALAPFKEGE